MIRRKTLDYFSERAKHKIIFHIFSTKSLKELSNTMDDIFEGLKKIGTEPKGNANPPAGGDASQSPAGKLRDAQHTAKTTTTTTPTRKRRGEQMLGATTTPCKKCVVRLKKVDLAKLQDEHNLSAGSRQTRTPKRRSRAEAATAVLSPAQTTPQTLSAKTSAAVPKKRGRPRNSDKSPASSSSSTSKVSTTTPTKSNKFSNGELIRQFGKRYLNAYVKVERCRHPLMEQSAAKTKNSKNLSVSFCDRVEIMASTENATTSTAASRRDEKPESSGVEAPAEQSFIENATLGAGTRASTPKKTFSPLKNEPTPSPRKLELKKADEKLPPNGLRSLNMEDDEEDEIAECEATEDVDNSKVNITTVAEIHQNPVETDENGKIPNDATCKTVSGQPDAISPVGSEHNISLATEDKTDHPAEKSSSPANDATIVEPEQGEENVPEDKLSVSECTTPNEALEKPSDISLTVGDENSTSSFASAEGQPHLDDEKAIDKIRSFIDEKSNTDDGKLSDDGNNDADELPSPAQFGALTASPRPALHSFQNKINSVELDRQEEEHITGDSECLRLFVEEENSKGDKDDDVETMNNIRPLLLEENIIKTEEVVSDYDEAGEYKSFTEVVNDNGDKETSEMDV